MDDIGLLLNDPFFVKEYVVRRPRGGQYIEGRWVESARYEEFPIKASVQPLDGRAIARLPEAQRTAEARLLYTQAKLENRVEELGRNADLVLINGECWEVSSIEGWGPSLEHQKCLIIKVTTDRGAA